MKIVNLTPHEIVVRTEGKEHRFPPSGIVPQVEFPPSGIVPRVEVSVIEDEPVGEIPTVRAIQGKVHGVRAAWEGTIYIVSAMVAQHPDVRGRLDVVYPDTSPDGVIRDAQGRIVAVKRFVRA